MAKTFAMCIFGAEDANGRDKEADFMLTIPDEILHKVLKTFGLRTNLNSFLNYVAYSAAFDGHVDELHYCSIKGADAVVMYEVKTEEDKVGAGEDISENIPWEKYFEGYRHEYKR